MKTMMQCLRPMIAGALIYCFTASVEADKGEPAMTLILTSPAFSHQSEIPQQFTCEGADISPALTWSGVPQNAKSLALIVDDPDAPDPSAPRMTWVHWVLYNIPASASGLPEMTTPENLPPPALQGKNDWKQTGYRGPCPPKGRHRYFFKLYALDNELPDMHHPDKARIEQAMSGHIIEKAELIGTYQQK